MHPHGGGGIEANSFPCTFLFCSWLPRQRMNKSTIDAWKWERKVKHGQYSIASHRNHEFMVFLHILFCQCINVIPHFFCVGPFLVSHCFCHQLCMKTFIRFFSGSNDFLEACLLFDIFISTMSTFQTLGHWLNKGLIDKRKENPWFTKRCDNCVQCGCPSQGREFCCTGCYYGKPWHNEYCNNFSDKKQKVSSHPN